jgi:uncharacterized protein (DUF58 family)
MEFDESRPYVPGDDVRHFDWNATARTGEPFVKRFREERDQTLILLLDVSASMAFASGGRTKAELAAQASALLAAAAGRVGDRVGLVAFGAGVVRELRPRRGDAHVFALVRSAVEASRNPAGGARSWWCSPTFGTRRWRAPLRPEALAPDWSPRPATTIWSPCWCTIRVRRSSPRAGRFVWPTPRWPVASW